MVEDLAIISLINHFELDFGFNSNEPHPFLESLSSFKLFKTNFEVPKYLPQLHERQSLPSSGRFVDYRDILVLCIKPRLLIIIPPIELLDRSLPECFYLFLFLVLSKYLRVPDCLRLPLCLLQDLVNFVFSYLVIDVPQFVQFNFCFFDRGARVE